MLQIIQKKLEVSNNIKMNILAVSGNTQFVVEACFQKESIRNFNTFKYRKYAVKMNTWSTILMFCFFILNCFLSIGQTHKIDSLRIRVYGEKNNGKKLEALISLGEYHQSINKDSLYQYALSAKNLASKSGTEITKSLAEIIFINALLRHGKTDSASALIEACLKENTLSDPATRDIYFKLAALKADCFGDASNYKDALSELYRIISEAEQYKDSLVLAKNMSTVGVINYNLDHVPEAFNWYFKGLLLITDDPRFYSVAAVLYINLAETYRWVQQTDSATFYIDKAILLCKKNENLFFLTNALRVKANIFKEKKEYSRAEETMMECIAIREKSEGKLLLSNEQLAIANIYLRSGNIDKAIKILNDALVLAALKPDNSSQPLNTGYEVDALKISYYASLAQCFRLKGDSKNYEETLEKIIASKDAFYQANSARSIAELQTKYEVQKKESTILQQKYDLQRKNFLFYGSMALTAILLVIAFALFRNYRKKQKIKMSLMMDEEKKKSEEAVKQAEEKERVRIASDLHDNLGAYAASMASNLGYIKLHDTDEGSKNAFKELSNNSNAIISQLNDTIWVLKKDTLTLTAISDRLKNFISRIQKSYPGMYIEVNENINVDFPLPSSQAFHLYRILQEAVNNAYKHSKGKNIVVQITSGKSWKVVVIDDGVGIPEEKMQTSAGNGLHNIKARTTENGWKVSWEKPAGGGTAFNISPTTN
ncbi:MAG TPA: ATP-binding protein [Chitinophagaceae bacterium]|nr:ATP-binding protein [Chitinophagaceae bacterium]